MNPCKYCDHPEPQLKTMYDGYVPYGYFVMCPDCRATGPKVSTQKLAIDSWNGTYKLRKTKKYANGK